LLRRCLLLIIRLLRHSRNCLGDWLILRQWRRLIVIRLLRRCLNRLRLRICRRLRKGSRLLIGRLMLGVNGLERGRCDWLLITRLLRLGNRRWRLLRSCDWLLICRRRVNRLLLGLSGLGLVGHLLGW
jgi:hypothetical protein